MPQLLLPQLLLLLAAATADVAAGRYWSFLDHLGPLLRPSQAVLGASEAHLGSSWDQFGTVLRRLGPLLANQFGAPGNRHHQKNIVEAPQEIATTKK